MRLAHVAGIGALRPFCLVAMIFATPTSSTAEPAQAMLRTEAGHLVRERYGGSASRVQFANMLQTQFERVAFTAEFGGQHRRGRLVRWERPIRVQLFGKDARDYAGEIAAHLDQLRRLTGHDIRLLPADQPGGNVLIWLETQAALKRLPYGGGCAMLLDDRDFEAIQARIFIPIDNPHERRHCIVEEVTQALGLANDSTVFADSIFNDTNAAAQLAARHDRLLVHLLYHPRLRTGMTLAQARPIAVDLISKLVGTRP